MVRLNKPGIVLAIWSLLALPVFGQSESSVSNERVTAAVKKAAAWVYAQQNPQGTWDGDAPAATTADRADGGQFGELTALAMQALLTAGEDDRDPRLQQAIDFLTINDRITGTCAVGLRAQVWPLMTASPAVRQAMARDRNMLVAAMLKNGRTRGLFSLTTRSGAETADPDRAASFHAVLGMKALADADIEVPDDFWRSTQRAWRTQQNRDGSWSSRGATASPDSANPLEWTADGAAVLLATDDELASLRPADCLPAPSDRYIELALSWIDGHFDRLRDTSDFGGVAWRNFGLYVIAHIGQISGRQFFNQRDWYQDGAAALLDAQGASGSWGSLPDTCFAMIFLCRGRNPVILSKLEYAITGPGLFFRNGRNGGGVGTGANAGFGAFARTNWNLRPRDVANISAWVGRQVERQFNWESVSLKLPAERLHDSSVLYMSGNQPLILSAEDRSNLKEFIEQGGMVLGNADCGAKPFADGFRRLGAELFPDYEFRNIPADSVIYTGEEYRASNWRVMPQALELNNGVRDLMILIPQEDPSRYFQERRLGSHQYLFELLANILFYSVDQTGERLKGENYWVSSDPNVPIRRTMKVARLEYDGNWDPEPGGWRRLAAIVHNTRGIGLDVEPIRPGEGLLDGSFVCAHVTGTADFHWTAAAQAEIASYVRKGGTLIIDAAGGSAAFDAAAQAEIKVMLPESTFQTLDGDDMIFRNGGERLRPQFRRYARSRLNETDRFRIQIAHAGRGTIYQSPDDLSAGLVGEPMDGICGYQPQVSTGIMVNILSLAGVNH